MTHFSYFTKPVFVKRNQKYPDASDPAYKRIISSIIIFVNKNLTINDKNFTENENYRKWIKKY